VPRLTIDGRPIEVPDGASVLDAARLLGIDIPALCVAEGRPPMTSCMACVVRIDGAERLVPSCATRARDGMQVESETPDIARARRTALELLLGDHLGDCIAPCQAACPAHMDIPRMIRHIAAGRTEQALETIKQRIALPAVLGRICPAPCEKACRRGAKDHPVSICLLKRYPADVDLATGEPWTPPLSPATGKAVAVIGAGPAGLAAAYALAQDGHACTVFDRRDAPGGALRAHVPEDRLPRDVLDAEIATVAAVGVRFETGRTIADVEDLTDEYDAVIVATGAPEAGAPPVRNADPSRPEVFVAGSAARPTKLAVRALADGRAAAVSVRQLLASEPVTGPERHYSTHVGRVEPEEIDAYAAGFSRSDRIEPARGPRSGFSDAEAASEALRCLHCDCRAQTDCKLRLYGARYDANPAAYRNHRRTFQQLEHPAGVLYEPGKCIACGLCVEITRAAAEPLGLTFVGRGFDVRVAVPFDRSLDEALHRVAAECVRACPTGALAFREPPGEA
jgi:ferredoxin